MVVKKLETVFDNRIWSKITAVLFPILLVLFSFIHINEGVAVTDTGYNYGNFVSFDSLDDMWKFSTYLASAIGALFAKLPLGQTMVGLNFYTGLFKIIVALMVYVFCIKVCKMRKEVVFVGEMIALGFCWCPTALIYNYLTYLLFHLGALLLYVAIVKEKRLFFVLAGVCLSVNVFVRLPNLAEAALILVVWLAGVFYKKRMKSVIFETLYCLLGYIVGAGTVFLYLVCHYGLSRYVDGILALFAMTDEASSYTVKSMIMDMLRVYIQYSKWLVLGIFLIVAGTLVFHIKKEKYVFLKQILVTAMAIVVVYLYKRMGMFTLNYRAYESMFGWGVMLLMACLLLGVVTIFSKNKTKEEKVLASCVCVILLITPLGSNNHLYSPMNNCFLAAAFLVNYIWQLLSSKKSSMMLGKVEISNAAYKIVMVVFAGVLCFQSFFFGASFVFRDGVGGEARNYQIKNNPVLVGMYTTEENGKSLQELNDYLVAKELIHEEAILFGNVPSLGFYFQLQPVLSSTWPDLASFSVEKFTGEISELSKEGKTPLVLMSSDVADVGKTETSSETLKEKVRELEYFIEMNGYERAFFNDAFTLYAKK